MKPHYYLFDFDGTLVDSMPTFVSSMLRILDENGVIAAIIQRSTTFEELKSIVDSILE